jgi:hypothetical protein
MKRVTLETITDEEFDMFCDTLPPRVLLLAQGGLVSWQKVIDDYYGREPQPPTAITAADISF